MTDEGVGVAVADAVLGLEPRNKFHMFHIARRCEDGEPVIDGLSVGSFDRWKVRSRSLDLRRVGIGRCFLGCHEIKSFLLEVSLGLKVC
jgi:hypothetical protein